jgi:hypothetical protein
MRTIIASLLLAMGCATSHAYASRELPIASVLTVNNQRAEQATIYVVHAGYKGRRLGQVNSLASATFVLTAGDAPIATDVQFLAQAMANGSSELSDAVVAQPGASYEWRLAPVHGQQFLAPRYTVR